jgi:hypothetical protein
VRPSNNINHYHNEANKIYNLSNFTQIRRFLKTFRPVTIAVFTAVFAVTTTNFVFADNLASPAFNIKMGTINITGGSKSSASYKLNDTVGQTAQGEFNSAGYTIKAGFQYVISSIPFSFTISDIDLDYGSLVPGTPSILSNVLTVTNGSAYGFTVKTIEDHPLKLVSGTDTIPDSACDLATPCSITDATPWTDNGRYGFGYNVAGTDKDPDFVNSTYYRPFPIQGSDQPSSVMLRSTVTAATGSAATVNYKVNISGSQAAGTYQNGIQFIAIPAF